MKNVAMKQSYTNTLRIHLAHLSGVTLEGMIPLAFRVEEDLRFAIGARDAFSVSRVDFQPGKSANLDLQHFLLGFLAI